ncbi:MAG: hypothetical protein FWE04_01580 [Oscillospiraceae bacterium]|nr:hypothetical protein [Oscillospiraceae bacterium]
MAISKAQQKANAKYNAKAYDRIEMKIPKGKKDIIKEHAKEYQPEVGEVGTLGHTPAGSMTGFICRAIDETIARDLERSEGVGGNSHLQGTPEVGAEG